MMDKEELIQLIAAEHEKNLKKGVRSMDSYKLIQETLQKRGYRSNRTGKPLTADYIRYIHSYGFRSRPKASHRAEEEGPQGGNLLLLVKRIVNNTSLKDEQKVEMIRLTLDSLEG